MCRWIIVLSEISGLTAEDICSAEWRTPDRVLVTYWVRGYWPAVIGILLYPI